jgi:hypothetical protein
MQVYSALKTYQDEVAAIDAAQTELQQILLSNIGYIQGLLFNFNPIWTEVVWDVNQVVAEFQIMGQQIVSTLLVAVVLLTHC